MPIWIGVVIAVFIALLLLILVVFIVEESERRENKIVLAPVTEEKKEESHTGDGLHYRHAFRLSHGEIAQIETARRNRENR